MTKPEDVLSFWLDEVGSEGWFASDETLDVRIRDRFLDVWERGQDGAHSLWLTYPSGTLAYCILMDQFPRNMFRGNRRAFASDAAALSAAKMAINKGWDMRIDEPARVFFYMPIEHSENLSDQDRCVRLILTHLPETGAGYLRHAKAHREIIRRFGRFPFRNKALGRRTTPEEREFLDTGGYSAILRRLAPEGEG